MRAPKLTPCETAILPYIVQGDIDKVIAQKLGCAESTIKIHMRSIRRKLQVDNRTQVAVWYDRQQRIWE